MAHVESIRSAEAFAGTEPVPLHAVEHREVFTGPSRRSECDPNLLPDPTVLLGNLAQCVVEAMAGTRDVDQVARWLHPDLYDHLLARVMHAKRARRGREVQRPHVKVIACHLQEPRENVVEAAVVVGVGERARAVAVRLVEFRGRWRAERLSVL